MLPWLRLKRGTKSASGSSLADSLTSITEPVLDATQRAGLAQAANTSDIMQLNFALWRMGFEAPSVIAMRTMGAAGWWNNADTENQMMVREKQLAFAKGAAQASLAFWKGSSPAAIMLEAVKPVQARTGSNSKRLTKSGPRIPGVTR